MTGYMVNARALLPCMSRDIYSNETHACLDDTPIYNFWLKITKPNFSPAILVLLVYELVYDQAEEGPSIVGCFCHDRSLSAPSVAKIYS